MKTVIAGIFHHWRDSVKKLALFFLILVVILMNYLASTVHQLIKETLWPQWPMCLILYSMLHATFLTVSLGWRAVHRGIKNVFTI